MQSDQKISRVSPATPRVIYNPEAWSYLRNWQLGATKTSTSIRSTLAEIK